MDRRTLVGLAPGREQSAAFLISVLLTVSLLFVGLGSGVFVQTVAAEDGRSTNAAISVTATETTVGENGDVTITIEIYNWGEKTKYSIRPMNTPGWSVDDNELFDGNNYQQITVDQYETKSVTYTATPTGQTGTFDVSFEVYTDYGDGFWGDSTDSDFDDRVGDDSVGLTVDAGGPSISNIQTSFDGESATIEADVSDSESHVDSVDLAYDTGGWFGGSNTVSMTHQSGITYAATIDVGWGQEFSYDIIAEDAYGNTAEKGPYDATSPTNHAPAVSVDWVTVNDDRTVTIRATATDSTNEVESVAVKWGGFGGWFGEHVEMSDVGGGQYEVTVPRSGSFDWGSNPSFDVVATDDTGKTSTVQTQAQLPENNPPSVSGFSTSVTGTDRTVVVEVHATDSTNAIDRVEATWYRGTLDFGGTTTEMTHVGNNWYRVTIPVSDRLDWGETVDIEVTAYDDTGKSTSTQRVSKTAPDDTAPPQISAVDVQYSGTEVIVEADVTDATAGVESVDLSYDTGWTDLFGSTTTMQHVGGATYRATVDINYGERYSFEISASDAAGNDASMGPVDEQVPRGTADIQVTNADDESKNVRLYVDGTEVGALTVPAGETRSMAVTVDPESRQIEIRYEEADRDGQTFSESTTAWIQQQDTTTVSLTVTERLAPILSVSCEACQLGTYDADDPPSVRIDVENLGGNEMEWQVDAPMFDVIERGDGYVLVEPVATGAFEHDVTIFVTNDRIDGEASQSVTVTGTASVSPSPPSVRWSALPPDNLTVGDGFTATVHGESGSAGTEDQPDPAPATDLEYIWYVDGTEVARTTSPDAQSPGSLASEQLFLDDPGEHEVWVEVVDPNTGKSSTTETRTVRAGEPAGAIVGYENPQEGDVYQLDTWYDVRLVLENTGDVRQTYEVEARTPSGTEVKEAVKRVTLNPGERTTVTFEQRLYGVNTPTRAFGHTLFTVRHDSDERTQVDRGNVTLAGPDVGTVTLEFVDGHGNAVDADFELYDAQGSIIRDGRGKKVYRFFEAGSYFIAADAAGHHTTGHRFDLEKNADRTVTVTVPTDAADASVDAVTVVDDDTRYTRGETVSVEATVRNTGDIEHTFFVGFGVRDEDGEIYDNDGTTGQPVTLGPGETTTVPLEWTVQETAPTGSYEIIAATWWEADRDGLRTRLDSHSESEAFEVHEEGAIEATLDVGHTNVSTDSKVAMRVTDAPAGAEYTWSITSEPEPGAGSLLHTTGSHTTLSTDAAGTYTVTVLVETADGSRLFETEIHVEDKDVDGLDAPAHVLAQRYAPRLHFHPQERFYPTRYEAYVENSRLDMRSLTVLEDPTLQDLEGQGAFIKIPAGTMNETERANLNQLLEEQSENIRDKGTYLNVPIVSRLKIDPGSVNDEYLATFQDFDTYPETVYTSIHENVTYQDEEYVAVGYWLFYINDPKPADANVASRLAQHTGDQEKVFVLLNESGPQWVAVQQHFGGEIRRWDKLNKTDTHPRLFVGEGSHPTVFEPYGGTEKGQLERGAETHEFRVLYQEQYLVKSWIPGTTAGSTDPHPLPFANEYTDPFAKGEVWSYGSASDADRSYDTVLLTERMAWAEYTGTVYTYPVTWPRGEIPMQSSHWDDLDSWLDTDIAPSEEHFTAEIVDPSSGTTPEIERSTGTVKANVTVANVGPQPDRFVLNVTARHDSGAVYTAEYSQLVRVGSIGSGKYLPRNKSVEVPVFPQESIPVEGGNWTVTIELASYAWDIRDEADVYNNVTFRYEHEPLADASIEFVETPSGDVVPGESVSSEVRITNTGDIEHTFFVGYGALGPDGTDYDNDGTTGKPVTLARGESTTVTVEWTVGDEIPEDEYDLVTAAWLESDRDALATRLDSDTATGAVAVTETNVGRLTVTSTPSDATIEIDGQPVSSRTPASLELEAGSYEVTVTASEYEAETQTVTVTAGEEQVHAVELDPTPSEPTAALAASTESPRVGEPVVFDASSSQDRQGSTLTYGWDLDGDGQFDDATGATVERAFDTAGAQTVAVRVSNAVGSDKDSVTVESQPLGATFDVASMSPSASQLETGEAVTVTTTIANNGDRSGDATVVLRVDGEQRNATTVTVDADGTATVPLAATLVDTGDRTVTVAVQSDGAEVASSTTSVAVDVSGTPLVESMAVDSPAGDAPVGAEVGETIPVTATLTYTELPDGVDKAAIVENSTFDVAIGGQTASVESVDHRIGTCTMAVGSDCQRQITVELAVTVPDVSDGMQTLAVEGVVVEGASFQAERSVTAAEVDAIGVNQTVGGVRAELRPVPARTSIGSTTTETLTVTNAEGGVGAVTATIVLEDTSVADIAAIDIADDPADVSISYGPNNNTVTVDAFGLGIDSTAADVLTVTLEGNRPGASAVSLSVDAVGSTDGESYDVVSVGDGRITVSPVEAVGPFKNPPSDQNGDGIYRDVNGDNSVDIVDVQASFVHLEDPTIQQNPGKFDYNGDGDVDIVDVQRLFSEQVEGNSSQTGESGT